MGPTFDTFAWLHGLVLLTLAAISLVGLGAAGISQYQDRKAQGRAERRHRLARLHADADAVRSSIEA